VIRTRVYRNGNLDAEDIDPARVSDVLEEPDTVVWLDICSPDGTEIQTVAEEVGLEPLAVEDAVKGRQRPKVDRYADHLFLFCYAVSLDRATAELGTSELALFASRRYLITARREPGLDIDAVLRAWDRSADLAKHGVGFLLYGLLDAVVDGHLATVLQLDGEIDGLEDLVFEDRPRPREVQLRSYQLRKSLVQLRRVVLPMREVLATLLRRESGIVDHDLVPYYQDVYDHVVRASEQTDTLREMITTLFETSLSLRSARLNEIMKKVTSYAALFAVPTAITGYYGMNVRTWPHAGTTSGGVIALLLTVVVTGGLFLAFRRREWL
jgi:magnesium transporter